MLNGVSGVQEFETRYIGKVHAGVCDFDELKYQKKKERAIWSTSYLDQILQILSDCSILVTTSFAVGMPFSKFRVV